MNREQFLKLGLLGTGIFTTGAYAKELVVNDIDELKRLEPMGFNHLPTPQEEKSNHYVVHRAHTRGHANHGWLDTHHTFSFANYYHPDRMHFGALRVLNDDIVAGGMGFGTHPHDNMEIISIPLSGDLEHKDSMNNVQVIKENDIQVMSAGTGIYHSEYNKNSNTPVNFLQIWVFPNKKNVTPRYGQIALKQAQITNQFHQIVSPDAGEQSTWVHQDAWFSLGHFSQNKEIIFSLKNNKNGLYAFVIEGNATIHQTALQPKDGIGIWQNDKVEVSAQKGAKILLMEVPMQL